MVCVVTTKNRRKDKKTKTKNKEGTRDTKREQGEIDEENGWEEGAEKEDGAKVTPLIKHS